MPLQFCPLYSSSQGNSVYVGTSRTRILVDAGKSGKSIESALRLIHVAPETIGGIFITHEHIDHIMGVGILARRYNLPVYICEKTYLASREKLGALPDGTLRLIEPFTPLTLGDLTVTPFAIPHDAAQPVGFRFEAGAASAVVATDIGNVNDKWMRFARGASLALLESNHNVEMLKRNPNYSPALKKRILSQHGHLSNEDSTSALVSLVGDGLKTVVLGHLSPENNTPELAYQCATEALKNAGYQTGSQIRVELSYRDHPGRLYTLDER
ncbi:MAG: MBL fold metallo-hydrolase [Eubacteriales bacterium]|nr:MBL fold metallo-hydrolase [Eubacteriales bacterium]MDD3883115.1 MBL fold metallo-hydrolase [Eubacteriales bacterium]MDD4513315.1 MBL fold metallo-hydrolase [Eubacteriales bacterium]